jgi:type II secretory pathway component GspD/PulD (secretin)
VTKQRNYTLRFILAAVLVAMMATGFGGRNGATSAAIASPIRVIDFVAIDEPIKETLIRLGKQFGANIVVEPAIQGRVTVTLRAASLNDVGTPSLQMQKRPLNRVSSTQPITSHMPITEWRNH